MWSDNNPEYFEEYYFDNLSLSEIAENENITRQAVRDNLKKGERKLFDYEEKLEIMKKKKINNNVNLFRQFHL